MSSGGRLYLFGRIQFTTEMNWILKINNYKDMMGRFSLLLLVLFGNLEFATGACDSARYLSSKG